MYQFTKGILNSYIQICLKKSKSGLPYPFCYPTLNYPPHAFPWEIDFVPKVNSTDSKGYPYSGTLLALPHRDKKLRDTANEFMKHRKIVCGLFRPEPITEKEISIALQALESLRELAKSTNHSKNPTVYSWYSDIDLDYRIFEQVEMMLFLRGLLNPKINPQVLDELLKKILSEENLNLIKLLIKAPLNEDEQRKILKNLDIEWVNLLYQNGHELASTQMGNYYYHSYTAMGKPIPNFTWSGEEEEKVQKENLLNPLVEGKERKYSQDQMVLMAKQCYSLGVQNDPIAAFSLANMLFCAQTVDESRIYFELFLASSPKIDEPGLVTRSAEDILNTFPDLAKKLYALEPKGSPYYAQAQMKLASLLHASESDITKADIKAYIAKRISNLEECISIHSQPMNNKESFILESNEANNLAKAELNILEIISFNQYVVDLSDLEQLSKELELLKNQEVLGPSIEKIISEHLVNASLEKDKDRAIEAYRLVPRFSTSYIKAQSEIGNILMSLTRTSNVEAEEARKCATQALYHFLGKLQMGEDVENILKECLLLLLPKDDSITQESEISELTKKYFQQLDVNELKKFADNGFSIAQEAYADYLNTRPNIDITDVKNYLSLASHGNNVDATYKLLQILSDEYRSYQKKDWGKTKEALNNILIHAKILANNGLHSDSIPVELAFDIAKHISQNPLVAEYYLERVPQNDLIYSAAKYTLSNLLYIKDVTTEKITKGSPEYFSLKKDCLRKSLLHHISAEAFRLGQSHSGSSNEFRNHILDELNRIEINEKNNTQEEYSKIKVFSEQENENNFNKFISDEENFNAILNIYLQVPSYHDNFLNAQMAIADLLTSKIKLYTMKPEEVMSIAKQAFQNYIFVDHKIGASQNISNLLGLIILKLQNTGLSEQQINDKLIKFFNEFELKQVMSIAKAGSILAMEVTADKLMAKKPFDLNTVKHYLMHSSQGGNLSACQKLIKIQVEEYTNLIKENKQDPELYEQLLDNFKILVRNDVTYAEIPPILALWIANSLRYKISAPKEHALYYFGLVPPTFTFFIEAQRAIGEIHLASQPNAEKYSSQYFLERQAQLENAIFAFITASAYDCTQHSKSKEFLYQGLVEWGAIEKNKRGDVQDFSQTAFNEENELNYDHCFFKGQNFEKYLTILKQVPKNHLNYKNVQHRIYTSLMERLKDTDLSEKEIKDFSRKAIDALFSCEQASTPQGKDTISTIIINLEKYLSSDKEKVHESMLLFFNDFDFRQLQSIVEYTSHPLASEALSDIQRVFEDFPKPLSKKLLEAAKPDINPSACLKLAQLLMEISEWYGEGQSEKSKEYFQLAIICYQKLAEFNIYDDSVKPEIALQLAQKTQEIAPGVSLSYYELIPQTHKLYGEAQYSIGEIYYTMEIPADLEDDKKLPYRKNCLENAFLSLDLAARSGYKPDHLKYFDAVKLRDRALADWICLNSDQNLPKYPELPHNTSLNQNIYQVCKILLPNIHDDMKDAERRRELIKGYDLFCMRSDISQVTKMFFRGVLELDGGIKRLINNSTVLKTVLFFMQKNKKETPIENDVKIDPTYRPGT